MIASPLEPELAERVRALPAVDELLYDEALLPAPRYVCDHAGDPAFRRNDAQEARWNAMVERAEAIFGYPHESAAGLRTTLETGTSIRFVQGTSAGMGAHVQRASLPPALLERVTFCSAAGVHAGMLAEFAFYGLLALRKDGGRLAAVRAQRAWRHFAMGELDGSTLAIVGMGQIGRAVARRAQAFGMRVLGIARTGAPLPDVDEAFTIDDLRAVVPRADAIVITLPITDRTRGLFDQDVVASLAPSAILVNVGRGGVVDQPALIDALSAGRIAGAVLDVFAEEPLPPDNPLWALPNVILSPHTAALSVNENERIVALFCDNLTRLRRGEPLRNVVNLVEFY